MSGWLVPPVMGDYEFWIASDDNGDLWLSSDDDPANKVFVCRQPHLAPPRWWDLYPEQKSGAIALVAGQRHYYEASFFVSWCFILVEASVVQGLTDLTLALSTF